MMNNEKLYVLTADESLRQRWLSLLPGALAISRVDDLREGTVLIDIDSAEFSLDAPCWQLPVNVKRIAATANPSDELGIACLEKGAAGVMHAYCDAEVLLQVLSVVRSGELWVGRSLLLRLLRGVSKLPVEKPVFSHPLLTERENEVALLVAKGESNKEIARALSITERTVKAHVSTILDKLNVQDRLQLALRVNGIM